MARKNQPLRLYKPNSAKSNGGLRPSDIRCPSWLPDRSRNAFKALRKLFINAGILSQLDRHALILLCDAWDEWMEARLIIKKEGMFYETYTKSGNIIKRPHPANARRTDAWNRIRSMLSEFGATPASRSKIVEGKPEELVKETDVKSYDSRKSKGW